MAELLLLLLLASAAGLLVAWPLLDRSPTLTANEPADVEAQEVRHRLALEAIRDLDADHRAGSLDDAAHALQRADAEAWAVETLPPPPDATVARPVSTPPGRTRSTAAVLGAVALALVLLGFALPAPAGIAERTVTDRPLADAIAAEDARQARISAMLDRLQADSSDTEALSQLADAYLAGGAAQDQQRGALALIALLSLEPENDSAYRRLITAYMNAGDWTDARSTLDAYEDVADADEPDIPFFRGLLALRGDADSAEAVRQFDRFLELAPHDPRAGMVLSLREQAADPEGGS